MLAEDFFAPEHGADPFAEFEGADPGALGLDAVEVEPLEMEAPADLEDVDAFFAAEAEPVELLEPLSVDAEGYWDEVIAPPPMED